MVAALAVLSLVVGAVLAAVQTDVKRMLAYSSISHAGFMLVGLQAGTDKGVASDAGLRRHLRVHAARLLRRGHGRRVGPPATSPTPSTTTRAWPGAARALRCCSPIFLLAQAGVPLTGGFIAKFTVIAAAVDAKSYALALVAMLSTVIAAFLYLRIVLAMYATGDGHAEDVVGRQGRTPAPLRGDRHRPRHRGRGHRPHRHPPRPRARPRPPRHPRFLTTFSGFRSPSDPNPDGVSRL